MPSHHMYVGIMAIYQGTPQEEWSTQGEHWSPQRGGVVSVSEVPAAAVPAGGVPRRLV